MSDTTNERESNEHADDLAPEEVSDKQEPATESADADGHGVYEAQNFGEPDSAQSGG